MKSTLLIPEDSAGGAPSGTHSEETSEFWDSHKMPIFFRQLTSRVNLLQSIVCPVSLSGQGSATVESKLSIARKACISER